MFDIRAAFEPLDGRVLKWRDFKEALEQILLHNISALPAHWDSSDLHRQADQSGWLTEEAGAKIKISLTPEFKENCMSEQNEFDKWDPTIKGHRFAVLVNGESIGGVSKRDFLLFGKYKGYIPTAILDASTEGPVIEQFVFKLEY